MITGQQIMSTLTADGTLTVELAPLSLADPVGSQIAVRIDAAPINPSDLGLLFGTADLDAADYQPGRIIARQSEGATRAMKARHGVPLAMGNECAGLVIAAGEDPAAQALMGKRVGCVPRTAFSTHALADATMAIILPDHATAEQGASCFVNPMTALAFVETMRRDGFTALAHTAAASNLGQMLVKVCAAEGIPLVNIVRSPEQVGLLRGLGAEFVVDSTAAGFMKSLIEALAKTGARMAFDAVGGGSLASTVVTAMEIAAKREVDAEGGAGFSLYGSNIPKKLYIYGGLDLGPTIFNRGFDFQWQLAGWLLPMFLATASSDSVTAMRQRVQAELTTTFASHYAGRLSLDDMLSREAVAAYNARRTGEKYLLIPNG